MGIDGVENLTPDSIDDPAAPPRPDDEVVEEQKREEEGIEPSEPIEVSVETPGDVLVEIPAEESSPPNPGGANADTENHQQ